MKKFFRSKTEKVNISIEVHRLKLVSWYQIFDLTDNYDFFLPDLSKKGFSGVNQKKWTQHIFYMIPHIKLA